MKNATHPPYCLICTQTTLSVKCLRTGRGSNSTNFKTFISTNFITDGFYSAGHLLVSRALRIFYFLWGIVLNSSGLANGWQTKRTWSGIKTLSVMQLVLKNVLCWRLLTTNIKKLKLIIHNIHMKSMNWNINCLKKKQKIIMYKK